MRPISAEASRGYSHLNSGTSKGSFTPLLQLKSSARFPSPLEREHESPAYIQRSPFPPPSPTGGILSLRVRKRIPGVPVTSQEGALSTERREEIQGRATIPRVPQMSQSIPGKPVSQALPRLSNRGSTDTTVARGISLWEILVGKPGAKASWESVVGKPRGKATDPLIHTKGSVTLLLQLGRKGHVHAPTRDED